MRAAKAANSFGSTAQTDEPLIKTRELNGEFHLEWAHGVWPYLQVIYDDGKGSKHVLTLQAQGGKVSLPIRELNYGGTFELSFSNGLRIVTRKIPR